MDREQIDERRRAIPVFPGENRRKANPGLTRIKRRRGRLRTEAQGDAPHSATVERGTLNFRHPLAEAVS